jgi:hypothetical protein
MNSAKKLLRPSISLAIGLALSQPAMADEAASLPESGKRLQNAYRKSVEAAVKPIRDRYVSDLKKLLEQSTKSGNLDEALALRNEMAAQHMVGEWKTNGGPLLIREDRTAIWCDGQNTGVWEIRDNNIIIKWQLGHITFTFPTLELTDTVRGVESYNQGKTRPITATRIR